MGKTVAALDIGGTSIKSGLWDGTRLLRTAEQDTNAKNGGAYVMERAIEILKSYQPFDAELVDLGQEAQEKKKKIFSVLPTEPEWAARL